MSISTDKHMNIYSKRASQVLSLYTFSQETLKKKMWFSELSGIWNFFNIFSFLFNLLEWHWVIKLYRFQAYNSIICDLYIVCSPSQVKSPSITIYFPFTLFYLPHIPFPLVIIILLSLPSKPIIWNQRADKELPRPWKTKGAHHHLTIIMWNVTGTYLRKRSELWTIKWQ